MRAGRKAERFHVKQSWPQGQFIEVTGSGRATQVWIGSESKGASVVVTGEHHLRAIAQSILDRVDRRPVVADEHKGKLTEGQR